MDFCRNKTGRDLVSFLLTLIITCLSNVTAEPASSSIASSHEPAQLKVRDSGNLALLSVLNETSNAVYYEATTLPPTELRIVYPPNAATQMLHVFPNRIRFSQSSSLRTTDEAQPSSTTTVLTGEPRANPDSFRDIDRFASERVGGESVNLLTPPQVNVDRMQSDFAQSTINQSTINQSTTQSSNNSRMLGSSINGTSIIATRALSRDYDSNAKMSIDLSRVKVDRPDQRSDPSSSSNVGPITVGALIGIIAGILTAMVLASFVGLVCYRRRHPTWNAAETDLRVLAAHYGSYWDDKTLPNYQFNDRMIWPGETHEEMIALDNDAFLKSLEDLGRVNSRPSSKTNWNAEEDQRQSTKV